MRAGDEDASVSVDEGTAAAAELSLSGRVVATVSVRPWRAADSVAMWVDGGADLPPASLARAQMAHGTGGGTPGGTALQLPADAAGWRALMEALSSSGSGSVCGDMGAAAGDEGALAGSGGGGGGGAAGGAAAGGAAAARTLREGQLSRFRDALSRGQAGEGRHG